MIGFTETAYIPEYTQLAAIVGRGKVKADLWPEWSRLQEKFGWKILLKAADRCEPDKRWSGNVEAICIQLAKDEADAQQPAPAQPTIIAPSLTERIRIWQPYYDAQGQPYPAWLRKAMEKTQGER